MKAFLFDLVNKLQRTSDTLDAKAILCNKTWRVFSDTDEKEVYIFMEDGKLVISVNGIAVIGSWMYVPANQSLVISGNNQDFLVHPIICNNVLALALDGSNKCCFLLDSTKEELDSIDSLKSIESYINKNANKMPLLSETRTKRRRNVVIQKIPSNAIYTSDSRLKLFVEIWEKREAMFGPNSGSETIEEEVLYIKKYLIYKEFTGILYTKKHNIELYYKNGRPKRICVYYPNKQLAIDQTLSDESNFDHYYDENGFELSVEEFEWDVNYYYHYPNEIYFESLWIPKGRKINKGTIYGKEYMDQVRKSNK